MLAAGQVDSNAEDLGNFIYMERVFGFMGY